MDYLRTLVSGKKQRLKEFNYNIDLSYISPRIIAMSYPGQGIEATYRNNIETVSKFLKERHGNNFRVYNLSGKPYDSQFFNNNVQECVWADHHSPHIFLLFELCEDIDRYLRKNQQNVIVVHCLAGKGRTGTLICAYLLFSGRFQEPDKALDYFAKKRFYSGGGVQSPSQRRYLYIQTIKNLIYNNLNRQYFYQIFNSFFIQKPILSSNLKYITNIKLIGIPDFTGENSCQPFIEIFSVKDMKLLYTDQSDQQIQYTRSKLKDLNEINIPISEPLALLGDLLIRILQNGNIELNRKIQKLVYVSSIIQYSNNIKQTRRKLLKMKDFLRILVWKYNLMTIANATNMLAFRINVIGAWSIQKKKFIDLYQQQDWNNIFKIMNNYVTNTLEQSIQLLFIEPFFDDYNEIIYLNLNQKNNEQMDEEELIFDEDKKQKQLIK